MSAKLSDEELDLLTDEERAGLEDGGTDANAGDAEAEGADTDADEEGTKDGDAQAGDAGAPDEAGNSGQGDPAPEAARPVVPPMFKAEVPADLEDKLSALDQREEELTTQFDDGDLTAAEYRAALREVSKERDALVWQARKAELDAEARAAAEEAQWVNDAKRFIEAHPDVKQNNLLFQSFDTVVRQVTGDPANSGLTNQQMLDKAYKEWNEALGRTPSAGEPPKKQRVERPAAPPTLAHVPSAEPEDTDGGRFAYLDRLADTDPLAYERELGKLSDADRDLYLATP